MKKFERVIESLSKGIHSTLESAEAIMLRVEAANKNSALDPLGAMLEEVAGHLRDCIKEIEGMEWEE